MGNLVFVRPYRESIRAGVRDVLELLGFTGGDPVVFARGTPDRAVVEALRHQPPPSVLVVPFHPHVDDAGQDVTGLGVLQAIRAELPALARVQTVMPVSQAARAAFMMAAERAGISSWPVFHVVHESELADTHALAARLRAAGLAP